METKRGHLYASVFNQPLTPLTFLTRSADVWSTRTAVRYAGELHNLSGASIKGRS